MIGLSLSLVLLVTVASFDCVVSVARVDSHMYAIDASTDQCLVML